MASSSSSSSTGVPPGFRFHPTDEELLLYYLKKKVSLEKFDLEVIREVDLNKIEPWDLQERCRIGATPQNEWYFFSHKDRKYPSGSRTNRATNAGFWKATGRDKCIRNTYKKIGMRKTLVFYRGRAPHGQKTDWIVHEYRLVESDDDQDGGSEDGWVVCRVFKKKCFFKSGGSEGSSSHGREINCIINTTSTDNDDESCAALYIHQQAHAFHHHHMQQAQPTSLYGGPKLGLANFSPHLHPTNATNPYSQIQVQDLLPNHRPPPPYDFSVLPHDSCSDQIHLHPHPHQQGRDVGSASDWALLNSMEQGRYGGGGGPTAAVDQMGQQKERGGREMDLWGYGK